jgi:protein arginine N-methyltransferase 1
MRIEYHRTLIADRVRNAAFHAALKAVIRPGETVVADVGAGTGLLAVMAAKLGAKDVFLYESAEVAGVAAEILKANRARNCHLFPCHSTEMDDPPPVDVVVSETLGNYAFEETVAETLNDARRRFLRPGGVVIPARLEQRVAPVVAPRIHDELRAWDEVGYGLDLSFARTMSLNNAYVRTLAPEELLDGGGSSQVWDRADFSRAVRPNRRGEASWRLGAAATIYGFCCWWTADLVSGVSLSTGPEAPRTHWEQLYFPLLRPIAAGAGDTVRASLRSRSSREGGTHLAWTALRLDCSGTVVERQALDLDKGFLP